MPTTLSPLQSTAFHRVPFQKMRNREPSFRRGSTNFSGNNGTFSVPNKENSFRFRVFFFPSVCFEKRGSLREEKLLKKDAPLHKKKIHIDQVYLEIGVLDDVLGAHAVQNELGLVGHADDVVLHGVRQQPAAAIPKKFHFSSLVHLSGRYH